MYRRILWLIAIYSILSGCSESKKTNEVRQVFVEKDLNTPEELLLSDIAVSVSYVPLQTDSSCLVGANDRFQLTNSYLVAFGERCLLFTRKGNFVRAIGKQGKGPGEYIGAHRGFVSNNKIYIPGKNIQEYDLNGNFIKTIQGEYNYLWQYPIGNQHWLGYRSYNKKSQEWCFTITSENSDTLITLPIYEKLTADNMNMGYDECVVTNDNTRTLFREQYNDTIFSITPDMKIKPAYVLNTGKFLLPLSSKTGWTRENFQKKLEEYNSNYFKTNAIISTNSYLFFSFIHARKNQIGYFSREGGEFHTSINKEENGFFENDIDGGPVFFPLTGNREYNELASVIWPLELLEMLKSKNESEFYKNYGDSFSSLQETDNPVVMIATLKE